MSQAMIYSPRSFSHFVKIEQVYSHGYEPTREIQVFYCDRLGKIVSPEDQDPYEPEGLADIIDCPLDEAMALEAFIGAIRKWSAPRAA